LWTRAPRTAIQSCAMYTVGDFADSPKLQF
jgi:hypothetical protein